MTTGSRDHEPGCRGRQPRGLKEHAVRRLPVIDGREVVGMVTQADVATNLPEDKVGDLVEQATPAHRASGRAATDDDHVVPNLRACSLARVDRGSRGGHSAVRSAQRRAPCTLNGPSTLPSKPQLCPDDLAAFGPIDAPGVSNRVDDLQPPSI